MPQIPLYNKGLGATGVTTGGSLGPRASAGAFTGVGQEVAKFGQAAGDIMRDFYDADKKAEAKTAIAQAENELTKEIDTHIKNDKTTSIEEFDGQYKKIIIDKKIKDIAGKYKLRPLEQQALVARLGDISAGGQLKGRNEAYGKQEVIRGTAVNDKLVRLRGIMASLPNSHPESLKASADAFKEISDSQKDGTIKYSSIRSVEQFNMGVEQETLTNKIEGASSFADLKIMTDEVAKSTQSTSIKNKFNKAIRAKRNILIQDTNQNIQDQLDGSDATYEELNVITDKLRNNEDVNITLASGKSISISGTDLPQNISNSVQKFISNRSKEVEDVALNDGSASIIDDGNNTDIKTTLQTADDFVKSMPDKEKAEGSVLSAALNLQGDAKRLVEIYKQDPSQVNADKIRQLTETSKELLETGYAGRPALIKQEGRNGTSANNALTAINNINLDLDKEIAAAKVITDASDIITEGNFTSIKESLTEKQQDAALKLALKGKDVDTQMLILERNNVKSDDYSNILSEGSTNILGVQPDINKVKSQIELFRIMKSRGNGVLENHLSKNDIAVYNSVLAIEQGGKSLEEAIGMVAEANRSGIDINAKYKLVESQVRTISSETTSFFGTKPQNSASIQQKVEDLSKVYIGLGVDPKVAVKQAGADIIASHINYKGVLIPRSINMNETDIKKNAQLIIDDYKARNKDDDSEITATPVTGRVDKWMIIRDGIPFPSEFYTLDQIKDLDVQKAKKGSQKIIAGQNKTQKDLIKTQAQKAEEERKNKIREENREGLKKAFPGFYK